VCADAHVLNLSILVGWSCVRIFQSAQTFCFDCVRIVLHELLSFVSRTLGRPGKPAAGGLSGGYSTPAR
jgi:hypothetical protein